MLPPLCWSSRDFGYPEIFSWPSCIAALFLFYIPFCAVIRRHQRWILARRHGAIEKMTLEEAYAIKSRMADEFPVVFAAATNSVFVKAQSIPTIASLVHRATQRSSSRTPKAPPRPPSTSATPLDLLQRPGSPAQRAAISRVNHVHSLYRPSGKMSDDDLLYVLYLFATEPLRWIARLEWRSPSLAERAALATLWRDVGRELRIPFVRLNSCSSSDGDGDGDALLWMRELEGWAREYEARNRMRSVESEGLARMQVEKRVGGVPWGARGFARGLVAAFVEDEARSAMGYETPSAICVFVVEAVICVRKFVRGYLCSPVTLIMGYKQG